MMSHLKASGVLLLALLLTECVVSGPKDDGRTVVEKFNGESYNIAKEGGSDQMLAMPILERKAIARKFSGHVYCGDLAAMSPAHHASVALFHEKQELASVFTDAGGSYTLSAPIDPTKSYEVRATGSCGKASRTLLSEQKRGAAGVDFNLK